MSSRGVVAVGSAVSFVAAGGAGAAGGLVGKGVAGVGIPAKSAVRGHGASETGTSSGGVRRAAR